jgi:hypothetical protein
MDERVKAPQAETTEGLFLISKFTLLTQVE